MSDDPMNEDQAKKPDAADETAVASSEKDGNQEEAWADAVADTATKEQAEKGLKKGEAVSGAENVFKPIGDDVQPASGRDLDLIMNIPVRLHVELGRTRISIKQLLELAQGSVLELDGLAGDPMDILINGYLIAQGEVVVVEDKYGIRITDIITPSERVKKLNR